MMKKVLSIVLMFILVAMVVNPGLAEFDSIRKGDKGERVVEIQTILKELGYLNTKVDGDFGNKTEAAVIAFQKEKGFDATGIIGEATYNALTANEVGAMTDAKTSGVITKEPDVGFVADVTGEVRSTDSNKSEADTQETDSDYIVTKEYDWRGFYGMEYNHGMVIKNTSGYDAEISVNFVFYDADNNIIGVGNDNENACENGYETFWLFSNEEPYDHVSYTITVKQENYYKSCQSIIDLSCSTTKRKAIVIATNTGSIAAEFVDYYILFLDKKGNIVYYDWGYLTDDDSELKPQKTEMRESECPENFTSAVAYAHGRSD